MDCSPPGSSIHGIFQARVLEWGAIAFFADNEHLIAKFRLKLKKVRKTTRLWYDLNQISYNCTVEVKNRFKGLDLIDRVPENYERKFMTLCKRQ